MLAEMIEKMLGGFNRLQKKIIKEHKIQEIYNISVIIIFIYCFCTQHNLKEFLDYFFIGLLIAIIFRFMITFEILDSVYMERKKRKDKRWEEQYKRKRRQYYKDKC